MTSNHSDYAYITLDEAAKLVVGPCIPGDILRNLSTGWTAIVVESEDDFTVTDTFPAEWCD